MLRFLHWYSSLFSSASPVGDLGCDTGVNAEDPTSVDEIMVRFLSKDVAGVEFVEILRALCRCLLL